ncbi:MAG: pyruvate kinase [Rickettsiales bacterium]|jgi:pyruvate kinase|nr:pyruvate kinase [Rickettsiales bacterium]
MKRTKIVATIGPKSASREIIEELSRAGVDIFRLNFSHGNHESHAVEIDTIRSANVPGAIMLDTKGPEIRTGEIRDKLYLKVGDSFILTTEKGVYEDTGKISVNYGGFINDVDVGDVIVLDSGAMQARAVKKSGIDVFFEVIDGEAPITTKRHINLFGKSVSLPTVTEQDWRDIDFGLEKNLDMIALSFVRTSDDIRKVKEYCRSKGHRDIHIIAKIENFESTQNLENIVKESDGIMVARGDLACEVQFSKVPTIQKKIMALCRIHKKPVIVATQMLLSMVENIRPTRAEVSDVANAVFEQADAVMTSDETAKGNYPVNTIKIMARIATDTEEEIFENKKKNGSLLLNCCCCRDFSDEGIIRMLANYTNKVDAIVVISNKTEHLNSVAGARINLPIFSFTSSENLKNNQHLVWNTTPILADIADDWSKNLETAMKIMKKNYKKYKEVAIVFEMGKNLTVQLRNV